MAERSQHEQFIGALKGLGGSAGNGRLREALGWDEMDYIAVREMLVHEGIITRGRGHGGSVALVGFESNLEPAVGDQLEDVNRTPVRMDTKIRPAKSTSNGSNLGFEAEMFKAADKLRGNMEPSDYKHVALGLIFLKHISDSFEAWRAELLAEYPEGAEDPDEYAAANVFWVPLEARWSHLQANAKQPSIGKLIDEAMILFKYFLFGYTLVLFSDDYRNSVSDVPAEAARRRNSALPQKDAVAVADAAKQELKDLVRGGRRYRAS